MQMSLLKSNIDAYQCISIIGLDKNVGKTTVLCHLIEMLKGSPLGITSIGRDGETQDLVHGTNKPPIYIPSQTIVATAKKNLMNSDITKEILLTTGIHTPMGEIIIARAKSSGYMDLAGPSHNQQIGTLCESLIIEGCEKIIVDGAISRRAIASSEKMEGTILVTGAAFSPNMYQVVNHTKLVVEMLTLKQPDETIINLYENNMKELRVGYVDCNNGFRGLHITTTLNNQTNIVHELKEKDRYLFIKGAVTQKLLELLIKNRLKVKGLTLVVQDGTKTFTDYQTVSLLKKCGIIIKIIHPINLLAVAYNPTSPYGYSFDEEEFYTALRKEINNGVPVINVLGGERFA